MDLDDYGKFVILDGLVNGQKRVFDAFEKDRKERLNKEAIKEKEQALEELQRKNKELSNMAKGQSDSLMSKNQDLYDKVNNLKLTINQLNEKANQYSTELQKQKDFFNSVIAEQQEEIIDKNKSLFTLQNDKDIQLSEVHKQKNSLLNDLILANEATLKLAEHFEAFLKIPKEDFFKMHENAKKSISKINSTNKTLETINSLDLIKQDLSKFVLEHFKYWQMMPYVIKLKIEDLEQFKNQKFLIIEDNKIKLHKDILEEIFLSENVNQYKSFYNKISSNLMPSFVEIKFELNSKDYFNAFNEIKEYEAFDFLLSSFLKMSLAEKKEKKIKKIQDETINFIMEHENYKKYNFDDMKETIKKINLLFNKSKEERQSIILKEHENKYNKAPQKTYKI